MIKAKTKINVFSTPRIYYIVMFVITLLVGVIIFKNILQTQDDEMRENLITYAKTIEESVDWQPFVATLNTNPNLIKKDDLADLSSKLNKACLVNKDCHFIYLLYLDQSENRQTVRFLLDASPQPASKISALTEIFVEASNPLKQSMKTQQAMVEGPVTDHWGSWVSARVPLSLTANTPHFVMLNIDVAAAGWQKRLTAKMWLPALLTTFFLAIFTALILRNRYVEQLLSKLFDSTSELAEMAYYDVLTGLPNRRLLEDRASQAFKAAKRSKQMVAIMFLDLDHFKEVNDTYGHEMGDKLLISVSERLKELLRTEDTVARIGGDEFVILLSKIEDEQQAKITAEKVIKVLAKPFIVDDKMLKIGGSIGVAIYSKHGSTPESLLKCADEAMYSAKRLGRNVYVVYADNFVA